MNTIETISLDALIELRNDCDLFLQKYALFPQFEKARLAIIPLYPSILQRIDALTAQGGPAADGRLF